MSSPHDYPTDEELGLVLTEEAVEFCQWCGAPRQSPATDCQCAGDDAEEPA
jgi:hypothetical protein